MVRPQSAVLDPRAILKNGSRAFTADQSLGGFKITNAAAPAAGGDLTNRTFVEAAIAASLAGAGTVRAVRVWRSTDDVHGAGTGAITLQWDTVKADVPAASGQVDLVNFPTRVFKCLRAGYYNFRGLFIAGGTSGNQLLVTVRKNGATELCGTIGINSGGSNPVMAATIADGPFLLAVNDYLEIRATTLNSNGSITIATGTGTDYGPFFSVEEVVDAATGGGDFLSTGAVSMTGNLNFGTFRGVGLADPVGAQDADTKAARDAAIAAAILAAGISSYKKAPARRITGDVVPGALADFPGLSVAPDCAGGECVLTFDADVQVTGLASLTVQFDIDGAATLRTFVALNDQYGAAIATYHVHVSVPVALGTGVHAIKVRVSGSNATVFASSAVRPASLVVEYQ